MSSPRTAPQQDERSARIRIRDAALRLWAARGAAVTVRQIAAAAAVSPALVMRHFGTVADLRAAVDAYVLREFRALLAELEIPERPWHVAGARRFAPWAKSAPSPRNSERRPASSKSSGAAPATRSLGMGSRGPMPGEHKRDARHSRAGTRASQRPNQAATLAAAVGQLLPPESPIPQYLGRLLLEDSAASRRFFRSLLAQGRAVLEGMAAAGLAARGADPEVRAALLTVNDLAVLLLRLPLRDALGFDPLSRPGMERWGREVLAIYASGLGVRSRQLGGATSRAGAGCRPSKPARQRPTGADPQKVASHLP